ncbi:unnamed protein product [Paramecium primaurelia]|uniref:RING-type domain-containing protein n=1 Tax=Paramecium primaurelia TaxID=5886 RepID=A0A8S1KNJ3_PARPR|nr:unnamed protein product [Paramecium primaurelia]
MSQLLSNTTNIENNIQHDDDLSDYDDVELPKMQRMNALIVFDQQVEKQIQNFVPKNYTKIYYSENCPICLENKKLIPLQCGHTFCFEDIQELIIQARKENRNISCCICRTELNPCVYYDNQLINSFLIVR